MDRPKLTRDEVRACFSREFSSLLGRFVTFDYTVTDARGSSEACATNPGVYVWWHPARGVIKVGCSIENSRHRALQHIGKDNTGRIMTEIGNDPATRMLLFNVRDLADRHWVLALEKYLEWHTYPEISSRK